MRRRVRGGDGELHGREVLDQWEIAVDCGWLLPSREHVPVDPGLVAEVAALQGGAL